MGRERAATTYLSEQYRTELLGTIICFSQVVLHVALVAG